MITIKNLEVDGKYLVVYNGGLPVECVIEANIKKNNGKDFIVVFEYDDVQFSCVIRDGNKGGKCRINPMDSAVFFDVGDYKNALEYMIKSNSEFVNELNKDTHWLLFGYGSPEAKLFFERLHSKIECVKDGIQILRNLK